MSRSGYTDDLDMWQVIRWGGAVKSAIRGKRGQAFLKELLAILDTMPEKRLIDRDLERNGEVCTLGAYGRAKGIDISELDPEQYDEMEKVFGVAPAMLREIMFENDDPFTSTTPEKRWRYMRNWVKSHIEESSNA